MSITGPYSCTGFEEVRSSKRPFSSKEKGGYCTSTVLCLDFDVITGEGDVPSSSTLVLSYFCCVLLRLSTYMESSGVPVREDKKSQYIGYLIRRCEFDVRT